MATGSVLFFLLGQFASLFGQLHAGDNLLFRYNTSEEQPSGTLISGDLLPLIALRHAYSPSVERSLSLSPLAGRRDLLGLDQGGGRVVTAGRVDREAVCPGGRQGGGAECVVWVELAVQPAQYFEVVRVEVTILDVNDHAPSFDPAHVTRSLPESAPPGTLVPLPSATDSDAPPLSLVRYQLSGAQPSDHPFRLLWNATSPDIRLGNALRLELIGSLDRELVASYRLNVTAYDGGGDSAQLSVDLIIDDINDNRPRFEREAYEASVAADAGPGAHVIRVTALDPDRGLNGDVRYRLSKRTLGTPSGRLFSVDPVTGDVSVSYAAYEPGALGRLAAHSLVVIATDLGDNAVPSSAQLTVHVTAGAPGGVSQQGGRGGGGGGRQGSGGKGGAGMSVVMETVDGNNHTATVDENNPPGTFLAHVTVNVTRDDDVTCFIAPPPRLPPDQLATSRTFSLVPLYGRRDFKLVAESSLDREKQHRHLVTVRCTDTMLGVTSSATLTVRVRDLDDNAPIFEREFYSAEMRENNRAGAFVIRVRASDADLVGGDRMEASGGVEGGRRGRVLRGVRVEEESGIYDSWVGDDRGNYEKEALSMNHERENWRREEDRKRRRVHQKTEAEALRQHGKYQGEQMGDRKVGHQNLSETFNDKERDRNDESDRKGRMLRNINIQHDEDNLKIQYGDDASESRDSPYLGMTIEEDDVYGELKLNEEEDAEQKSRIRRDDLEQGVHREKRGEKRLGGNNEEETNKAGELVYSLSSEASGLFRIDRKSGEIFALVSFDRETRLEYQFLAFATTLPPPPSKMDSSKLEQASLITGTPGLEGRDDEGLVGGVSAKTAHCMVHVTVIDVDDELPRFARAWYKFEIREDAGAGAPVGSVSASDPDAPPHAAFVYRLDDDDQSASSGSAAAQFALDPDTGVIYTRRGLDRETASHHTLRVRAVPISMTSQDDVIGSESAVVFIRVTDTNDNAPEFVFPSPRGSSMWRLRPNSAADDIWVSALDKDEGSNAELVYSISDASFDDISEFRVDARSGLLSWNRTPLSSSTGNVSEVVGRRCPIRLSLQVRDSGTPPLFAGATLYVLPPGCDWTAPAQPADGEPQLAGAGGGLTQFHVLIIACALGAFVVLVILLVVVIVCVARRRRRRQMTSSQAMTSSRLSVEKIRTSKTRLDDLVKGGGGGGGEGEDDEGGGERDRGAYLLFDRDGGDGEGGRGEIVLYVKEPGKDGAEPVARFKLQPLAETDGSTLYMSRGGRRAGSDESNLYASRGDRDTDSGCMDVSIV